jgi:hypothetical protein
VRLCGGFTARAVVPCGITVTHDNSTMLPPHFNANLMTVNNIQPWRVKFKTSNPHQPSSLDRGDHPITKFTTFNTEISHRQEQEPVTTFTRENSNPCNLGLYNCPRYFSQQQFERQLNSTSSVLRPLPPLIRPKSTQNRQK